MTAFGFFGKAPMVEQNSEKDKDASNDGYSTASSQDQDEDESDSDALDDLDKQPVDEDKIRANEEKKETREPILVMLHPPGYFRDGWNYLDFFTVGTNSFVVLIQW